MCIDRALRGQSLSGAKGVSRKTLYSRAGFPCVETNAHHPAETYTELYRPRPQKVVKELLHTFAAERKVYPERPLFSSGTKVLKPTTHREIQKTVQTIVILDGFSVDSSRYC